VPGLPVPSKYLRTDTSVPQLGLDNRTSPLYTGVVIGGGTVVNGMFFNRGSAGDYDAWENLGNPGWGWEGLLPYFKKVRNLPRVTSHVLIVTAERNLYAALRRGTGGLLGTNLDRPVASWNRRTYRIQLLRLPIPCHP